ncbi:hypothetical protein BDN70DRAFT_930069 [Pholiota conissans]|uniref:DUF6533 domain-containing protein n=1 Tax=Pholiota conissans TaxID=109636 RepID=A0A9P6CW04_9AGAR|nr:hypothetical protein BDN70DRAFT_930069 [Pholiota conissans]
MNNSTSTSAVPIYESTPLIYFPHEVAYQISVAIYIHVGCMAVLIWDIIDNLKGDYRLLFHHRIQMPTIIYFISRTTLLAYMITRTILLTVPIKDCGRMYDAINALLVVFVAATTAMFYLRVCAVYLMHKGIVVFYGILWLAVLAMLLTLPETFTAVHIATTGYCIESMKGPFLGPTTIILMVNDALVYGAIAYKIFSMFAETTPDAKFSIVTFGRSLPVISKALLKDSQLYFMVVIVTNPFLVACVYVFDAPLDVMFLVCHLVLVNILSCRVYRNLKMGLASDIAAPKSSPPSSGGTVIFLKGESTTDRKPSVSSRMSHARDPSQGTGEAASTTYDGSSMYAEEPGVPSQFVDLEKAQIPRAI